MSSEYFEDLKRVVAATPEQIKEEKNKNLHADEIKSKFEEKKAKALQKIKNKQSSFITGTQQKAKTLARKLTGVHKMQENYCTISKEPLTNEKTYFLFASYHHTNVALIYFSSWRSPPLKLSKRSSKIPARDWQLMRSKN